MNITSRQRPLGITIIALVLGISALLGICGSATALGFAPFHIFGAGGLGVAFSSAASGLFGLIIGVLELLLAFGLWTLQPWAFWATVIVEVLNLINSVYSAVSYGRGLGLGFGIHILPILILAYLFLDGNVRRAFRT